MEWPPLPEIQNFTRRVLKAIGEHRLAVFAGAGVSKPSGLPLAHEIIQHIADDITVHASLPHRALAELSRLAPETMRLEVVIRILMEIVGDKGLTPLQELSVGTPTTSHRFLAACLQSGIIGTVITTNFDTLIEQACADLGIQARTLVEDDDYREVQASTNIPTIAKLHGSLDMDSGLPLRGIFADVRRIGQGLGHQRAGFLRSALRERHLLVLGYSGRDYFGAMPEIFGSTGPTIFWVSHHGGSLDQHVRQWLTTSGRGIALEVDTDAWISFLAKELGIGDRLALSITTARPRRQQWTTFSSKHEANLVGSMILAKLDALDDAAQCLRTTIEAMENEGSKDKALITRSFLEAGRTALKMGGSTLSRYYLAHGLFSRAYSLSPDHPQLRLESEISLYDMQFCLDHLMGRTPIQYLFPVQVSYEGTFLHRDPVLTSRALALLGRIVLNSVADPVLAAATSSDLYEQGVERLEEAGAQDVLAPLYLNLVNLFARTGQKVLEAEAAINFLRTQLLCTRDQNSPGGEYGRRLVEHVVRQCGSDSMLGLEVREKVARLGIALT